MFQALKGDKVLWGILGLLAIFSFLPIFSASSNLVYVVGKGTPWGYFMKHFVILTIGFVLLFSVHKIPSYYFRGISILMLPIVVLLLIYTATQGTVIAGANASRWIRIPIIGLSFQTSTLASVVLMTYSATYLSKLEEATPTFKSSLLRFWLPVFVVVLLIFLNVGIYCRVSPSLSDDYNWSRSYSSAVILFIGQGLSRSFSQSGGYLDESD
jgi:cell division protein FtsW